MLDIDVILNDTDIVKKSLESKGFKLNIELVKKLSSERKKLISLKESLAAEKNSLTEKFKNIKSNPEKEDLKNRSKELETEINKNKNSLKKIEVELNDYLLGIPNVPDSDVPVGKDEHANAVIKEWGIIPETSEDHSEMFKKNNLLDFESAVTISRSRFVVMKDEIAILHRALINYM